MKIPRWAAGVLDALRFDRPSTAILESLDERQWREALSFCDRTRLTLVVGRICAPALPEWVRQRIGENTANNRERAARLEKTFLAIAHSMEVHGAEFVALRGMTHWKDYVADASLRCQYDIDLFCPPDSLAAGLEALESLGYEPLREMEGFPTDHLPSMIRKTGWQWHGDFFDPEIPFAVDLHFRFWDEETECFDAPGAAQFWDRRIASLDRLHPVDALGSASLHALRHLLRSSLSPFHIYEIAYFLETHAEDAAFWDEWRELHPERLRQLEAICFRLAADWFGCKLSTAAAQEIAFLPPPIRAWFEEYSASPLETLFHPNKNELWLHLALIESARNRRKVLVRRLAPRRMPGPVDAVMIPDERMTWRLRLRKRVKYAAYVASRMAHHLRVLPSVAWEGGRWWLRSSGIGRTFWIFLGVSALFDLGLSIFFLLYNLYLLDLGFNEGFLGSVTSAMTAGAIAGTLPAGFLGRRIGLRKSLALCVAGAAIVSAARALATGRTWLVILAFLDGAFTALWAVSYVPAIAQSAGSEKRPLGFSLVTIEGIAIGIFAGLLGGWMPGWLTRAGIAHTALQAKRIALLAGCATTLAALPLALAARFPPVETKRRTIYPRNPFVFRFLIAIAVWNLATGAFNPFFNTYFARYLHRTVESIGWIYSGSQLAQVAALMAAPIVLRKFGLVGGIMGMQLATGLALYALGVRGFAPAAASIYASYMAFQCMSEPGLFTLLMNHVPAEEQSGASALNFLVIFGMNAIAAAAAGAGLLHFGYPAVLAVAGGVAAGGALLFRAMLGGRSEG